MTTLTDKEKRLLAAFRERKELTMPEMIDVQYGDDPDGGPLYARECIHTQLFGLRRKTGLTIRCRTIYRIE